MQGIPKSGSGSVLNVAARSSPLDRASMPIERLCKRLAADRASFIEPCLPSPAPKPPAGSNWIHEIKHDGFRLMARRDLRASITRQGTLVGPLPAGGRVREPPQGAFLPDRRRSRVL